MGTAIGADVAALLERPAEPPALSPLFRKVDWWTFAATSSFLFIIYLLTMAPDLTLRDDGELVTATANWFGVPNNPGYPVWTILTGLFIRLVPISNTAYRASMAAASEGALACGLVALMVSRASSLMAEGMASLRDIEQRRRDAICAFAGYDAGMLLGLNSTLWSQAVTPEIYPLGMLSFAGTLVLIFRWIYAPQRRRYIYWAALLYGICIVNHFTFVLAALGLEIAVLAGDARLGRDLFAFNVMCWLGILCLDWCHVTAVFESVNPVVLVIFNIIGALSLLLCAGMTVKTRNLFTEWKPLLVMVTLWLVGNGFFSCLPIASMTNPPMNWGYPRTVEGFYHVISRGQYDKINPSDFLHAPGQFARQNLWYLSWTMDEFPLPYLIVGLVPFALIYKMRQRERRWIIGMAAVFFCLSSLLIDFLNPTQERQTSQLVKVFLDPSYVPISICTGCGFALTGTWLSTKRRFAAIPGTIA